LPAEQQEALIAAMPRKEKEVAASLVKRNAFQLSKSLAPLLGDATANTIFGIGVLGMGFSSIIILMLINGYAFCEMLGKPQGGLPHIVGCLVAGLVGACWWLFWDGDAKMWLAILVSAFGMMLLPIAYVTFMLMMNSTKILGDDKPRGGNRVCWNILMGVSVLGALAAALTAILDKASHPIAGPVVILVGVVFLGMIVVGFVLKSRSQGDTVGAGEEEE
jgi:Mn2+/Fe2+ NRAMP family transporter